MARLSETDVTAELLAFVRDEFLDGDPDNDLTEDTPLLAYGILNSLRTVRLLAFARERLGADVTALAADPAALASVGSLSRALTGR
ncbi:phosphopantetheine binding protein [Asanoa ferruginea]|uniref:Phosphopantetheine binding protein n=1 Tax=Asanoa ferruginea TaxID=53367 RepID=A0A3D9ZQH0_9ACTN|nr:phosphopantetheine-binding protein [Asanoa ferruginea]REF98884.1 phosphopantetheine binding protein [Asanoa ferruginea]GIF46434.1 hypothetical protein Afe04nite_09730 [Asanoa ferruginea]